MTPARILLVEDDPAVSVTLAAVLEGEGHLVQRVADLKSALTLALHVPFELGILDIELPDGNGLELLGMLRRASPDTVLLTLTGYGSRPLAMRALQAGAFDYLLKPCDVVELKHAVGRAIEWQRLTTRVSALAARTDELEQQVRAEARGRRRAQRRARQIETLDRSKEEFFAAVSHDLKHPLTAIKGYTQLLLRQLHAASPDREVLHDGLHAIDGQATLMARLVNDLLDVSRIEAGSLALQRGLCNLPQCLENVLRQLSPEDRSRVQPSLSPEMPPGNWDQRRLEQVLANLVSNALKYSDGTKPVSVTAVLRPGEVEVAVRDEGIGIEPEELSQVFERFYRTSGARESGRPGTGLGLHICSGIINAHGGRIWAASLGKGQGATFSFVLPV